MSDPRPLLRSGANDFEADLLRAGRADELPSTSRRRILMGLGVGGGVLSATTVASGVKATSAKSLFASLCLGGAVTAVSGVAIWAGISALSPDPAPSAARIARAPVVLPERAPAAPAVGSVGVTEAPNEIAPPAKAPASRSSERGAETLSLELAALEQSRAALAKRDYSTALRLLDDYTRRFPKRRLDSEATVLRIEALAARGDRALSTRLGNQFLATHANSPYARRVRSLIGDSNSRPSL
jgi:TolA-binding protein